jgi:L-fuconolactonase
LNHLAGNPLFRGIRLGGGALGNVADQSFLNQLEQLASLDLELDLLIDAPLLSSVNTISEKIPDLRIMINHIGHVPIDGQPPDTAWVEGMEIISKQPNVYCKASGFVELAKGKPPTDELDYYRPTMDVLWNLFGIDCLVYGSNWPVSERYAAYQNVQQLAFRYFETKGSKAVEKVFWGNSKEFYKWIDRH